MMVMWMTETGNHFNNMVFLRLILCLLLLLAVNNREELLKNYIHVTMVYNSSTWKHQWIQDRTSILFMMAVALPEMSETIYRIYDAAIQNIII
jgi:hypothetical protein